MSVTVVSPALCRLHAVHSAELAGRTEPAGTQLCLHAEEECDQRAEGWKVGCSNGVIMECFNGESPSLIVEGW